MNTSEIKKTLYKEKPIAQLYHFGKEVYKYRAATSLGIVHFEIPIKEMGELLFESQEQAQLLIRWLKL